MLGDVLKIFSFCCILGRGETIIIRIVVLTNLARNLASLCLGGQFADTPRRLLEALYSTYCRHNGIHCK